MTSLSLNIAPSVLPWCVPKFVFLKLLSFLFVYYYYFNVLVKLDLHVSFVSLGTRCQNFLSSLYIANSFIVPLSARHFLQSENIGGQFPLTMHSRFAWNVQRTHVTVSVQNGKI